VDVSYHDLQGRWVQAATESVRHIHNILTGKFFAIPDTQATLRYSVHVLVYMLDLVIVYSHHLTRLIPAID
jgi:hypothetical protein